MTRIEFPVFHYTVYVEIASDFKKALRSHKRTKNVPSEPGVRWISVHEAHEGFSFIFLKPDATTGEIAHESYHVVRRILEFIGADEESEVVAYHLEYMVDKITRFIRKRR